MRKREVLLIGLLALTLAGCADDHTTPEPDASSESDASEPDVPMPESDASTTDPGTSDATLAALSLLVYTDGDQTDALTLTPEFDSATLTYTINVGLLLAEVTVVATPTYDDATIEVKAGGNVVDASEPIGLKLGATLITINVTSGSDKKSYALDVRRNGEVLPMAYVKASNTGMGDEFGYSVSLWGDTLAVGAYLEDSDDTGVVEGKDIKNGATDNGAVYVFTRSDAGRWDYETCLKGLVSPDPAQKYAQFGYAVSLWGNTLAVSEANPDNDTKGAVYVFTRSEDDRTWSQQDRLTPTYTDDSRFFGISVSLWGDMLAVGARRDSSQGSGVDNYVKGGDSTANSGAVYVFTRLSTGKWWSPDSEPVYIKASNIGEGDHFGQSVSLWGNTLAVGAWHEDSSHQGVVNAGDDEALNEAGDNNGASNSGAVYVFTLESDGWYQEAYIKASDTAKDDKFGKSVSLWGDTLAVGADLGGANDTGAVYVFSRSDDGWAQQWNPIKASNAGASDGFGFSVSLWGDTLAVGAWHEDSEDKDVGSGSTAIDDDNALNSGAVYVFSRTSTGWEQWQMGYVKPWNTGAGDEFGQSVSLWGDTLAVGARYEDSSKTYVVNGLTNISDKSNLSNENSVDSGAVYIFQ